MKNKTMFSIFTAIGLLAVLGIGVAAAYPGFENSIMQNDLTDEQIANMQAKHDAMQEAIENQDYASWEGLMQERLAEMEDQITPENFQKIIEHHEAMSQIKDAIEAGNYELAQELREDLGFEGIGNHSPGMGMKMQVHAQEGVGNGDCPFME